MIRTVSLRIALAGALLVSAAGADVVTLPAAKDNTLFDVLNSDVSNGAGPVLFAGNNSQGTTRRAVLAFDVAAAVPSGSTVHAVTLTLNMSQTNAGPVTVDLMRLTSDWGEGASSAPGGSGAPATPGDATWLHTFFPDAFWGAPGGDFVAAVSASLTVDQPGPYSWSGPGLVSDVQGWLAAPGQDHGWIILADETLVPSAKRFDSREHPNAANRPALTIDFTPPPEPGLAFCFGDGSGTACPCGNDSPTAGEGCVSSAGVGMTVAGSGSTSIVADDLVLTANQCPPGNSGVFFSSTLDLTPAGHLYDGNLCIDTTGGSSLRYTGVFQTNGTASDTAFVAQDPSGFYFVAGGTYSFQYFSRDVAAPSSCGSNANLSPGYSVVMTP